MQNSKMFILSVVSFLFGVALGTLYLDATWYLQWVFSAAFIWFLLRFSHFQFVLLCTFLFGVLRIAVVDYLDMKDLSDFEGFAMERACVVEEVDERSDKVIYVLESEADERFVLSTDRYPVYEYGDCLEFEGDFISRTEFEDSGYDKYLKQRGIIGVVYAKNVKLYSKNTSYFWKNLYALKRDMEGRLSILLPSPYAEFMGGLLLGSRSGLPEDLNEKFNITGLTHIVAISGYNISLVIIVVNAMFSFLGRKKKVFAATAFVVLFVFLVGAEAAVVRAAIMGLIGLMALYAGRKYYVSSALFAAVFLMVLWNPYILIYDKGAQLSFLATGGIVYVSPFISAYFRFLPERFGLRESALMTISAQVLVVPLIVAVFGRLSLISVLANIFVLPLIPWAMIFGFMALMLSYLMPFVADIFAFIAYLLLSLVIDLVNFFSALPFASLNVENFPLLPIIAYYCLLLRYLFFRMSI